MLLGMHDEFMCQLQYSFEEKVLKAFLTTLMFCFLSAFLTLENMHVILFCFFFNVARLLYKF